jgi:hypothetical protein
MAADKIFPMLLSVVALVVSGYGLYESSLKAPDVAIYVAPRVDYTDPDRPESVLEVFVVPVTLANHGARSSTIHAIDLEVKNPRTGGIKRFYAARLGAWGETPLRPFTPVALQGKASYSQAIQFLPRAEEKIGRVLDQEGGEYELRLRLDMSAAGTNPVGASEVSLSFKLRIGSLDYRFFSGKGTMEMWAPDYRSSASTPR